jgi:hypothetical protein
MLLHGRGEALQDFQDNKWIQGRLNSEGQNYTENWNETNL